MKKNLIGILSLSFLLTTSLFGVASVQAEKASPGYNKYCNDTFGFCVEYPADFGVEPAPSFDNGRVFYNDDGVKVDVSGEENIHEDTLKRNMEAWEDGLLSHESASIESSKAGKNWYVIEGHKMGEGGMERVFIKAFVGKGSIQRLYITVHFRMYGPNKGTIQHIINSFTPGDVERELLK